MYVAIPMQIGPGTSIRNRQPVFAHLYRKWKSKKQNIVAQSSAKAEYRTMVSTASKLTWIKQRLSDFEIKIQASMQVFCDNQAARHIASNPVFHKRTKHIDVDCHFIREKIQAKEIETHFIRSEDQLTNIFTKGLDPKPFEKNISKLGLINLYNPSLRRSVDRKSVG